MNELDHCINFYGYLLKHQQIFQAIKCNNQIHSFQSSFRIHENSCFNITKMIIIIFIIIITPWFWITFPLFHLYLWLIKSDMSALLHFGLCYTATMALSWSVWELKYFVQVMLWPKYLSLKHQYQHHYNHFACALLPHWCGTTITSK